MSVYVPRDEEGEAAGVLACLTCNEKTGEFSLEVAPKVDPWDLPPILREFCERSIHAIDATWTARWVRSRIVACERQNLDEVLRANGLASDDEPSLLGLTEGRCAQDSCYLTRVPPEDLPARYVPLDYGIMQ